MIEITLKINDVALELPYHPKKVIPADDTLLVFMRVPAGEKCNQNVQAFNQWGQLSWTIDHPGFEDSDAPDNPFVSLERRAEGLVAIDWKGNQYRVDPESGEVEFLKWTK